MIRRQAGFVRVAISIVLLVIAGWVFFHRQQVLDQLVVWQYKPSSGVEAIAERAKFTDAAKFTFYAAQPSLEAQASFNKHCKSQEQESIVLGCYTEQRIYVYNVTDKRLDGVKEVTAAHEMLHAAYERLPGDERKRIDGLLEKEMAHNTDKELRERLKVYARTEPGERDNELHSILGTETAKLSNELEDYYAQYFTKRVAVTKLFAKYRGIFNQLKNRQDQLLKQLNAMALELSARTKAYNNGIVSLNSQITAFNKRADEEGGFSSVGEFNSARAVLVAQQQSLEAEKISLSNRIAEYNAKRKELQSLNLQARDLQNSLDSTPAPVPQL